LLVYWILFVRFIGFVSLFLCLYGRTNIRVLVLQLE
jgi:hypothetical protein